MTEVVELVSDWQLFLIAVGIFGLAPGLVLRIVVRVYPKDHPRREELVAELYAMSLAARPFWVAQQFETAMFEAIPARRARRKDESANAGELTGAPGLNARRLTWGSIRHGLGASRSWRLGVIIALPIGPVLLLLAPMSAQTLQTVGTWVTLLWAAVAMLATLIEVLSYGRRLRRGYKRGI